MKARIISVRPNYLDAGDRDNPNRKVMGTWDVELVVIDPGDLTYEQAVEYFRDQTDFELVPIDK